MKYAKAILHAIKLNKEVICKAVVILVVIFALSYLPAMILVYTIRTLVIGFALILCGILIYIGVKNVHFKNNKKKHIN